MEKEIKELEAIFFKKHTASLYDYREGSILLTENNHLVVKVDGDHIGYLTKTGKYFSSIVEVPYNLSVFQPSYIDTTMEPGVLKQKILSYFFTKNKYISKDV